MKVFIYSYTSICVHAWEKKYPCKSAFVWNDHIKVIKSNVEGDEKIYGASNFAAG